MNIAVTAASGQLGSRVVNALRALKPETKIIGLARTPANASHLGVEYIEPDVGYVDTYVKTFGTRLNYMPMSVEDCRSRRPS